MKMQWQKGKLFFLAGLVLLYCIIAGGLFLLLDMGFIESAYDYEALRGETRDFYEMQLLNATESLNAAVAYTQQHLVREDGHVYLYYTPDPESTFYQDNEKTNSEALSYYLQWTAQAGLKEEFDTALDFIEEYMQHPQFNYLQWRVEEDGSIVGDGTNIASDADLRAIHALLIAEEKWGDERYSLMIDELADGLELVAVTTDALLAPYGGIAGADSPWTGRIVWLSYADYVAFDALAERHDEPWISVRQRMEEVTIRAQTPRGLFNSELTQEREESTGNDGQGYSINSMWMMIRAAESKDRDLEKAADKGLDFFKARFEQSAELYGLYNSNGDPLSGFDNPWVYALVGRAAAERNDAFSDAMVLKMREKQVLDSTSPLYGAFPESSGQDMRIGQFTMQEAILTLQSYVEYKQQQIADLQEE